MAKKLLMSTALIIMTTSVFAADLPSRVAPPAYVPPPLPSSWTGFYLGAEGGYAWDQSFQFQGGSSTEPYHPKGFFGGGTAGYNWQYSQFVLGVETDFSGADISGGLPNGVQQEYGCGDSAGCRSRINWFGTARGRIGYAFGDWLIYGTGGYAYGNIHTEISGDDTFSSTSTRSGWAAGAGVEWMFAPSWSAKVEYLHADFGHFNFGTNLPIPVTGDRFDAVKAGINYHFNWLSPTPVVARY